MIAPSPDWFIGVNSVNLLDTNSNWKTSISLDLYAYDSGTDSGTNYTSANSVTNPFQNISSLRNIIPFNNNKIGTLVITLTETLSSSDFINNSFLSIFYNSNTKSLQIKDIDNVLTDLKIYSTNGKLIQKNYSKNSNQIDLNSVSNGVYIVKITTKTDCFLRKL